MFLSAYDQTAVLFRRNATTSPPLTTAGHEKRPIASGLATSVKSWSDTTASAPYQSVGK